MARRTAWLCKEGVQPVQYGLQGGSYDAVHVLKPCNRVFKLCKLVDICQLNVKADRAAIQVAANLPVFIELWCQRGLSLKHDSIPIVYFAAVSFSVSGQ